MEKKEEEDVAARCVCTKRRVDVVTRWRGEGARRADVGARRTDADSRRSIADSRRTDDDSRRAQF